MSTTGTAPEAPNRDRADDSFEDTGRRFCNVEAPNRPYGPASVRDDIRCLTNPRFFFPALSGPIARHIAVVRVVDFASTRDFLDPALEVP